MVRGRGQVSLETVARDGLLDVGKLERRPSQRERFRRLVAVRDALFGERNDAKTKRKRGYWSQYTMTAVSKY